MDAARICCLSEMVLVTFITFLADSAVLLATRCLGKGSIINEIICSLSLIGLNHKKKENQFNILFMKEVIGRITDPANNLLLAGTDPANNLLLAGTPLICS